MTYDVNSGALLPDGWVFLDAWTGRDLRHLPVAIREPEEALTHCESIVAALGDCACDPRSGGIAGAMPLALRCGLSLGRFRRDWLPQMEFVRDLHGIPVSNVASVDSYAQRRDAEVLRGRLERIGRGEGE